MDPNSSLDVESTGVYPDIARSIGNPFSPSNIFSVEDLVVVITGGGTGECQK
jgi:hypothetical protein